LKTLENGSVLFVRCFQAKFFFPIFIIKAHLHRKQGKRNQDQIKSIKARAILAMQRIQNIVQLMASVVKFDGRG